MRPLPYANAGAKTVFTALILIWVATELLTRARTRGNQTDTTTEWGSLIAIGLTFAVGFGAAFTLANHAEGAAINFARWPIFILGALLVAAGIAFRIGLMLGNWLSLACLAILPTAGLAIRIRVEERALPAGIGEPYRRFLATRSRLVPRVW
jgi:protein-S-isoprenylcysteine O-methyltransferase Ste14